MLPLVSLSLPELQEKSTEIRRDVIAMLVEAKSGHAAGSLGMADVFAALYFGGVLRVDPKKPWFEERDRLVLSNGHICPVLYATLAEAGFFPKKELLTLRQLGSRLQGHPVLRKLPGIETSSGSLGQGLSVAAGMAVVAALRQKKWHTYCVVGDGEMQEGQIWEALSFGAAARLHNLTLIIDRNNIQSEGYTEDIRPLEPLREKLEAFGWQVLQVDGHNHEAIIDACHQARAVFEKPVAIVANTIPGKGVEFMEGSPKWHAKVPSTQEATEALKQLHTLQGYISRD